MGSRENFKPSVILRPPAQTSVAGVGHFDFRNRDPEGPVHAQERTAPEHRSSTSGRKDLGPARVELQARSQQLKLVDEDWRFLAGQAETILNTGSDFTVIGVLGGAGLGKSAFLNRLCGLVPGPTGSRGAAAPFGTWPANGSCGGPTTTGIDIRVSSDRVIALDTQPVRSAGVLLRLLQREALPAGLGAAVMGLTTTTGTRGERRPLTDVSAEALAELMDLQIAMWLLRVCDAVVVMCPESDAEGPLELISAAGMLLSSVPRPTSTWQPAKGGTDPGEENVGTAAVIPGIAGCSAGHKLPEAALAAQRAASCILADSDVSLSRGLEVPQGMGRAREDPGGHGFGEGPAQEGASFFALPTPGDEPAGAYEQLCSELCAGVLSAPRQQGNPLREQEWLAFAQQTWSDIQKSGAVSAYLSRQHETRFRGAPDWQVP